MPKIRLTEISVRNVDLPQNGQLTYWDTSLAGFGLRVNAGGSMAWIVMHGRDRRRITIGRYPLIGIAAAREQAKKLLAEASLTKTSTPAISIEELVVQFLKASELRNKKGTTDEYRRLFKRHVLPTLAKKRVGDIRAHDALKITDRLMKTPSEANHTLIAIKAILSFAHRRQYIEFNPCQSLPLPAKRNSRSRALNNDEIALVFQAATALGQPFGNIVKLCLLTGQRPGEIALLKWEYIDTKEQQISLPAQIVKNNRNHSFPYGDMVATVLCEIPRQDIYLFPTGKSYGSIFNGWGKQKIKLDEFAPLPHWTPHDLRRTFATQLASLGISPHVIERLINHASGTISGIAAVYNRYTYLPEMRAAITAYEFHLREILALANPQTV